MEMQEKMLVALDRKDDGGSGASFVVLQKT